MEEEGKVFKKCSICKGEVAALIYECPSCKSKFCLACAHNNESKCPNCKQELSLEECP